MKYVHNKFYYSWKSDAGKNVRVEQKLTKIQCIFNYIVSKRCNSLMLLLTLTVDKWSFFALLWLNKKITIVLRLNCLQYDMCEIQIPQLFIYSYYTLSHLTCACTAIARHIFINSLFSCFVIKWSFFLLLYNIIDMMRR